MWYQRAQWRPIVLPSPLLTIRAPLSAAASPLHSSKSCVTPPSHATLHTTDTDFDGDEIYLEDLWQQTIHVPNVRGGGLAERLRDDGGGVIDQKGEEGWMQANLF